MTASQGTLVDDMHAAQRLPSINSSGQQQLANCCKWYLRSGTCRAGTCKLTHVRAASVDTHISYDERPWSLSSAEVRRMQIAPNCFWTTCLLSWISLRCVSATPSSTIKFTLCACQAVSDTTIPVTVQHPCTAAPPLPGLQEDDPAADRQAWRFSVASYNILADKYVSNRSLQQAEASTAVTHRG